MTKNNLNTDTTELLLMALESANARIKELEEALQFYASGEHMEADDFDLEINDQGDFDYNEYQYGKLAREVLNK